MGKRGNIGSIGLRCAHLVVLFLCAAVFASPNPSMLIDAGIEQLKAGRPENALKSFTEATREDPKDAEAPFFAGVALNRLGRAEEALAQLTRAKELGSTHPDLPFEMGWSLLTLRRWDEAIEQLKRYEATNPGRGQTSEFLGRAYLALGKYPQADAAFTEALKRDPDLLPTVSVYRALLRERQGDEAAARDEISTLFRAAPNSPIGQLIGTQLLPVSGQSAGPWRLSLRTALGYNSDARGLNFFKPSDPLQKTPEHNSTFVRFGLDTSYDIITTRTEHLTAGYDLLADSYFRQETDPDLFDQFAYLEWSFNDIRQRTTTTFRIWDNHTFVGEDQFRNEIAAQARFDWRVLPTMLIEGSYRYAHDDYLFPISRISNLDPRFDPRIFNPDAEVHTLTLSADIALPRQRTRLSAGYFHTWNFAKGDDYDYHSDGVFAGLTTSLPWKLTADAFYVYTWDRYEDPNSATPSPSFPRKDDAASISLRLTRPISPHLSIYFEYDFNHDNSNIRGYDYDQHITSGGLIWQL